MSESRCCWGVLGASVGSMRIVLAELPKRTSSSSARTMRCVSSMLGRRWGANSHTNGDGQRRRECRRRHGRRCRGRSVDRCRRWRAGRWRRHRRGQRTAVGKRGRARRLRDLCLRPAEPLRHHLRTMHVRQGGPGAGLHSISGCIFALSASAAATEQRGSAACSTRRTAAISPTECTAAAQQSVKRISGSASAGSLVTGRYGPRGRRPPSTGRNPGRRLWALGSTTAMCREVVVHVEGSKGGRQVGNRLSRKRHATSSRRAKRDAVRSAERCRRSFRTSRYYMQV
jgi:hypothetical protein